MEENKKISLTGSLASLTKEVQNKQYSEDNITNLVSEEEKNKLEDFISLAKKINNDENKATAIYVYGNFKRDVEMLKMIDGLENIPLSAIVSAIIDDFLQRNLNTIKDLLKNSSSSSRF